MGWTPTEPSDEGPRAGGRSPTGDDARTRARWNVIYFALAVAVLFVAIVFPGQWSAWVVGLAAAAIVVIILGLGGEQPADPWQRRRSANPSWDRVRHACARLAPYATLAAVIAALIQSLRP